MKPPASPVSHLLTIARPGHSGIGYWLPGPRWIAVVAALITYMLVIGGPAVATPSTANVVASWPLDEATGTLARNSNGPGNDGALVGPPRWVTGRISSALAFDGTDEVDIGDIPDVNDIARVTLAAWIKRDALGAPVLLGKQTGGGRDLSIRAAADGRLYAGVGNGLTASGSVLLNDTLWHHVALVFDGTLLGNANRLKIYVDGVQRLRRSNRPF